MIRLIAAIDSDSGLADDSGIPWQGRIPSDVAYFRKKTIHGTLLMGYGWYSEQKTPLPDRRNLVATTSPLPLREGFEKVGDAREFLKSFKEDIWVAGGAGLFASTLDLVDELYLTQLNGVFNCTKFFPEFENDFVLVSRSKPVVENGISFCFEVWKRQSQKH